MPKITLEQATKLYTIDKHIEVGVEEIDLTIEQGEFVFLIGSSGAGKSTLLSLIAGTIRPDRGTVCLDDKDIQKLKRWSRNRTALVFGQVWQEPRLIRKRTIQENLEMVARIGGPRREYARQMKDRIEKVLGLVGMSGVEKKYPGELSGGDCRRIELARALINSPDILVLDELTANLDDDNIWDIFQLLNDINRKGTTVIMATHASEYVNIMRRRVITLVDGHILGDVKRGKYGDIV